MSYVRHEINVTDSNWDGGASITIRGGDSSILSQTDFDAAVAEFRAYLALLPNKTVTAARIDESGTVL